MKKLVMFIGALSAVLIFVTLYSQIRDKPIPVQSAGPSSDAPSAISRETEVEQPNAKSSAELTSQTAEATAPRSPSGRNEFSDDRDGNRVSLEEARGSVRNNVLMNYWMLLDRLGLTQSEEEQLVELLTDDQVAKIHENRMTIDLDAQSERIAEIIGTAKMEEFRRLQKDIDAFGEVGALRADFARNGLHLTDMQARQLVDVVLAVQGQQQNVMDAERSSIDYLKQRLAKIDEFERLLVEQAPSVLSPEQVQHMFENYQRNSYKRASALEMQIDARADNPDGEHMPVWYPARHNDQ